MAALNLNFIGELEVIRNGRGETLPPSKKTRALLAYLALNPRRLRRESLCELLWELPDDPRGSLRWSLSKLRRVVDEPGHRRIVADRNSVGFDAEGVDIDVRRLHALATDGLEQAPTEALESVAGAYRGSFLAGLELSGFDEFHAWCAGQRERAARDQATLLRALTRRLAGEPERAVAHARELVVLTPYDEGLRAELIRLLIRLRQNDEARHHFEVGRRLLAELGVASSGALAAAWRRIERHGIALRAAHQP